MPYSNDINTGLNHPYMGVDAINVSPRIAFSWAPNAGDHFPWFPGQNKTVISGGVGIFYDNPAAGMLDFELGNPGTRRQPRCSRLLRWIQPEQRRASHHSRKGRRHTRQRLRRSH